MPDFLPQPLNTEEELKQLCLRLQDDTYKLHMVRWSAISDCLELVCYVCLTVESNEYSGSGGGLNSTNCTAGMVVVLGLGQPNSATAK